MINKPCSPYVRWGVDGKSAILNLGQLHPDLAQIELERRWHDWKGSIVIDGKTYSTTGRNRFEALAELLNLPDLIEVLKDREGDSRP